MWYTIIGYMIAFVLTMPIMTALGALAGSGLSKIQLFRNSVVARIVSGVFGFIVGVAAIAVTGAILYSFDLDAGYTMPSIAGAGACLGGYTGMKSSLLDESSTEETS